MVDRILKSLFSPSIRREIILGIFFISFYPQLSFAQDIDPTQMVLVFSDEFESDQINWDNWYSSSTLYDYMLNAYTRDNAELKNGNLILKVDDNAGNYPSPFWNSNTLVNFDYTGGSIQSNRHFKYGYFEIRAIIPANAKGCVPSFWLFRETPADFTGKNDDEIDIFEVEGYQPSRFQSNLHWYGNDFWGREGHIQKPSWYESNHTYNNWHTYGVLWEETKVTFYYDRQAYYSYDKEFTLAMYILLSLAVNGNGRGIWDGPPDHTTVFPVEFVIDYIRVFKKQKCNEPPSYIYSFESAPHKQSTFIASDFITPWPQMEFVVSEPVKIYKNDSFIEIYASNQIRLLPGFKTEPKANFGAYIYNCPNDNYMLNDTEFSNENFQKSAILDKSAISETNEISHSSDTHIKVYPNPARNDLNIQMNDDVDDLEVIDLLGAEGELLMSISNFNDGIVTIDVSEFSKGTYILVFYFFNNTLVKNFVIK
jgi:beta-glucanase (GH16 family)